MSAPWLREFKVSDSAGKGLQVREWGDPTGPVVIFHHGTPSSSSAVPGGWTAAEEAGIRLLTFDRPGYGRSDRQPGRRVVDAARWSRIIADSCGVDEFAVAGTSGGGPHAAAVAAELGDRVTRLCIIVGLGPADGAGFDPIDGMLPATRAEINAARTGEAELRSFVNQAQAHGDGLDDWMQHLPASDREILGRPAVKEEETFEAQEWQERGIDGWVDDDLAFFARPWGYSTREITVQTLLVYGGSDVLVPASHGAAYLKEIPTAEIDVIPGAGHWVRDQEPSILGWLTQTSEYSRAGFVV